MARRLLRAWTLFAVILPLLPWVQVGFAREPPPPEVEAPDRPYWRTNLFKRVLDDQKFLVTRWWPAESRRPGFTFLLVGATAAAATSQDPAERSYDFFVGAGIDAGTVGWSDRVAGDLTTLGYGLNMAALLGATYLCSRGADNDRLAEATSLSAEALLDAGIWLELLKKVTARVRPNQTGAGSFFQYGRPENGSFPSGHAAGAFAVATVFAEQYRETRWVPWVAYGTATLIGTSRIALGRHFPSDVLVGGLLGNSIGRAVVARQRGDGFDRRWTDRVTPLVDASRQGYGIAYTDAW